MKELSGRDRTYSGPWWQGRFWMVSKDISGKDNVSKAYLKYEETGSTFWYVCETRLPVRNWGPFMKFL